MPNHAEAISQRKTTGVKNMNRLRCLAGAALLIPLSGCGVFTVDVPARTEPPVIVDRTEPVEEPPACPPVTRAPGRWDHLPQRTSFSPRSNVELKEGLYDGDFELGSVQIRVTGAGVGKTVIDGDLIIQTQCVVSNLTITGNVIFEGHQAQLVDCDFYGKIIDKGMQNRY
jgi:hypothetical protein